MIYIELTNQILFLYIYIGPKTLWRNVIATILNETKDKIR